MDMIQTDKLLAMIASASNHLQNNRGYINDLNIFPVPDGDTGTNMGMTFGAASRITLAEGENEGAGRVLDILAKAALRNARGNSGVILSQILRGLATAVQGKDVLDVKAIKNAACEARDTAYRAVMKPTEGTILTVVRETAEYADAHVSEFTDATEFMQALLGAAKESLAKTPDILPVLKQAGVVDAGGMGVVTLLEGATLALSGNPVALQDGEEAIQKTEGPVSVTTEEIKFLYCTEFLIQKAPERKTTQFRAAIQSKGDCMLVIEDDEVVKVHIHTNHPGYVIEQALKLGELTNLKIDNMKYQHEEKIQTQEGAAPSERKKYGFVAVSAGAGLSEVFTGIGVDAVVEGGQTMNPSTQDLLNAVQKIHAETVFIFPNNKNIILAAEQVPELADCKVVVIPTKNIPQGISAMLAFDEGADVDENKEAMTEMMQAVTCGQITFAARNSSVDGLKIKKGDIMGMVGSTIRTLGKDLNQVAEELVDGMLNDESGVISIYYGAETDEETAKALQQTLAEKYDYLDVSLIYGGQPVYYYFLAVE
ncbi:MAG: DAK2 domain-containing protein [Clostridia bacterium]|nr:DAK2 domain-containing protein [Clostridia bacterium]